MAVYVVTIAFAVPGTMVLTVASGLLFGAVWGTIVAVISATLGGTVLFVVARSVFGEVLRARAGAWFHSLEAGFKAHALSYLIVIRLVAVVPFFIINLVTAFLGVPLPTFVLGTFVGIIPASFAYAAVGAGLGSIFDAGAAFSLQEVLTSQVTIALGSLVALALVPVVYRTIMARRSDRLGAPAPRVS
jgi:uncharacterized membrane protein YdjX (TVP38/TMEM64 family)